MKHVAPPGLLGMVVSDSYGYVAPSGLICFFPYCPLPTAYCLLPTAYCLLPTAYCLDLDCARPAAL